MSVQERVGCSGQFAIKTWRLTVGLNRRVFVGARAVEGLHLSGLQLLLLLGYALGLISQGLILLVGGISRLGEWPLSLMLTDTTLTPTPTTLPMPYNWLAAHGHI